MFGGVERAAVEKKSCLVVMRVEVRVTLRRAAPSKLDKTYRSIIKRAVEETRLVRVRADEFDPGAG